MPLEIHPGYSVAMFLRRNLTIGPVCMVLALASSLPALAQPLSEAEAVERAIHNNPTLKAAGLDRQGAERSAQGEAARYGFTLRASAGATHMESPAVTDEGPIVNLADVLDASIALDRDFPTGTRVSLSVSGDRAAASSVHCLAVGWFAGTY